MLSEAVTALSDADVALDGRVDAVEALVGSAASPTTTKLVAVLDRITSTTTVASTAAETTLYTKSIDHADFNTYALRLTIGGTVLNNTGGSDFFTVRVKFGATTIASVAVVLATASSTARGYIGTFTLTYRSTSSQRLDSSVAIEDLSTTATGITRSIYGAATESTSGAGTKTLAVTVQPNTSSANLTWVLTTGLLERL